VRVPEREKMGMDLDDPFIDDSEMDHLDDIDRFLDDFKLL
jgi:hypothetical protein